jgi:peptidoglycan hydrolase-like protein with peptidoglycan-binding domain
MLTFVRCAAVCVIAFAFAPAAHASSFSLELAAPASATYGDTVLLRGRVVPVLADAPVTVFRDGVAIGTPTTGADGTFAFRTRVEGPAVYSAAAGELVSAPAVLAAKPRVTTRFVGSGVVGTPLRLQVQVQPARAFHVEARRGSAVWLSRSYEEGDARIRFSTLAAWTYRTRVTVAAGDGWLAVERSITAGVVQPRLALGSRGASVRVLESRLQELRYALPRADSVYGLDTYQAVLAFQKVNGLPWTGQVDARVWKRLRAASPPRPRYGGDHIEVSKGSQYLLLVRGGKTELVVHVSTGATGNTPIGRWQVYRKVTGWDWVLWYPMYFLRGFAIHGYPSVPAYPASHGCVRVPMWVATQLYSRIGWGQTIYVYW